MKIHECLQRHWRGRFLILVGIILVLSICAFPQTASTGAIAGRTVDPSGAVLPAVTLHLQSNGRTRVRIVRSDAGGRFAFSLLRPGEYALTVNHSGFAQVSIPVIRVFVTETTSLEIRLPLMTHADTTQVSSESTLVQPSTSSLGRALGRQSLITLPLVTRNYAQITALSPGVTTGVYNAGELGTGATALSQVSKSNDGIFAHGARSYDNNWQLDGISVSDAIGSGAASGGIPIPSPDALQEFKVQTGLYSAAFGRGAGANVSVVSRTGSDAFHGTLFEFLRNNILNANGYFLNKTGQPRPDFRQNQFGVTLGGPLRRDRLHFFGSYQGTRQVNGLAAGQARVACAATLNEPPLTNDRSPAAIGQLFGGMKGALGGVAVQPDGSNINAAALALLNLKLPDGTFLIPTPQTIDDSKPLASQGLSAITDPCRFNENQLMSNIDWIASPNNQLAARAFIANSDQIVTFPSNGFVTVGNIRGFPSGGGTRNVVLSLAHTYTPSASMLNQARIGFVRTKTTSSATAPFKWSDIGVAEGEMNRNNELPSLNIAGSVSMASAFPRTYPQDSIAFSDDFSLLKGSHFLNLGGSITRSQYNVNFTAATSALRFLSWPDFLLGMDASANGTGRFSNVFASNDFFGLLDRQYRAWEGTLFVQDDYRLRPTFTLNLGLRYERIGQYGDSLGRNSSFDVNKADRTPPATGALNGYIVSSTFPGALPPGVERSNNTFATYGKGQNSFAPRIGFAWQVLPRTSRLTLRGGYGLYYSRPPVQMATLSVLGSPFALLRNNTGLTNAAATFQQPFAQPFPTPDSFPVFVPYAPGGSSTVNVLAPDFRPAMVQQFSLNIQAELHEHWLVEAGYMGTHGMHLQRLRSLNQALSASPEHPINNVDTNTLTNIQDRVPVPGVGADTLREMESGGQSWYNGLELSLTKRSSHGFDFLLSYTFSKTLDTDGADVNGISAGNTLTVGDQNAPRDRWGRASFDRTNRLVVSGIWSLPSPHNAFPKRVLGGWSTSAVLTVQSGSALTILQTNSTNVFGISTDRAQLSGSCSNGQIGNPGTVQSKLTGYFNTACFTTPPVIGADGIGTAFGNSGTGIVNGPAQADLDLALLKSVSLRWPAESTLQFRIEFYNALNHPQFANPDTNISSPAFGVITSTAVSSRVGQLAVKFIF